MISSTVLGIIYMSLSLQNKTNESIEYFIEIGKYRVRGGGDQMYFENFGYLMTRLLQPSQASLLSQCSSYAQTPSLSALSDKESSVGTLQVSYTLLQQHFHLHLFVS